MRSLWKGSIGFGLVNIPVSLYSATEESNLSFVSLDKNSKGRIRYKKVSETTGKEVKTEDILKAYQIGNEYVTLESEDFDKANPTKKDHIDIVQFVNEKEVDALYFEKAYYLAPEKGGDRAYLLLREALKKEAKAALGLFLFHNREWVCLLKPTDNVIMLHRFLQKNNLLQKQWEVWQRFVYTTFRSTVVVKTFIQENRDWYSSELLEIADKCE